MKRTELAIAIDTQRLADGEGEFNPHYLAVPTGLSAQELLEFVYKDVIEEALEFDLDLEDVSLPEYDYLWSGSLREDGGVIGSEFGGVKPLSEDQVERMVAEAKQKMRRQK
jgi:hypothetical protein